MKSGTSKFVSSSFLTKISDHQTVLASSSTTAYQLYNFFFLRDFIFKKTLFEKLQYLKQEQ